MTMHSLVCREEGTGGGFFFIGWSGIASDLDVEELELAWVK